VSPAPRRGTPAGEAFLAVRRLARGTGADVQELLTLYALEGLLTRVAASRHREDLVLKGGVLLAAFGLRRPTRDIDLRATGVANDVAAVLERVQEIAVIDVGDGLVFSPGSIAAHTIREDEDYSGVRVRLLATLGRARLPVGIDVSFGDPVSPAPVMIDLPRLVQIGQEPVQVLGYPLVMVIAEKIVTAIERGEANTRWRDFADVLAISGAHEIVAGELLAALRTVATHRAANLRPLLPALAPMPGTAQTRWAAWRRRQAHAVKLPEQFGDVLRAVAAFTRPVLDDVPAEGSRWNPTRQTWEPGSH
jgi:hypothetical protein